MSHTYSELKHKTVAQLREIAAGIQHEAVKGYTQLNKDHLVSAICKALNIDAHITHHTAVANKAALKARIKALKKLRDEALAAHDADRLTHIRGQINACKNRLRQSML